MQRLREGFQSIQCAENAHEVIGNKFYVSNRTNNLIVPCRSHTNTRDYICDICQKGFTNKSDLTKHKITHSDLRYYQCVQCTDRYFAQKVHLKKHLKSQHSEEDEEDLLRRGTLKEGVHLSDVKPPTSGSIFIRTRYTPNE